MTVIWTSPTYGRRLRSTPWANAIVIEVGELDMFASPRPLWATPTGQGPWEIGFPLKTGVRTLPLDDGTPPLSGPLRLLEFVTVSLEESLGGKRVLNYLNPAYESNGALTADKGQGGRALKSLLPDGSWDFRSQGGKSTSDLKVAAVRKNLEVANDIRVNRASVRTDTYEALVSAGLTYRQIAEQEGVSVRSVQSVLMRMLAADKRERQEQASWLATQEQERKQAPVLTASQVQEITAMRVLDPGVIWKITEEGIEFVVSEEIR